MRSRGIVRLLFGITAPALLALGVWQCARDTTSPGGGAMRLHLRTLSPETAAIDSVEIEVQHDGAVTALDTVPVLEGSFSATFALPSGGPYRVAVFARGEGSALLPDSLARGVLGFGRETDIELRPGRLTEVEIALRDGHTAIDTLIGQTGYPSLEIRWNRVVGATAYNLGWFVGQSTESGYEVGITDTLVQLDWDGPVGLALKAAGEDTLFFAVQPMFGERAGLYGETWPGFLAAWMSLPKLISIHPGQGEVIAADDAQVSLTFDRIMDADSMEVGLRWEVVGTGASVPFQLLPPSDDTDYLLVPEAGTIQMGTSYRVILTTRIADAEGRPFDVAPELEGLQGALIEWSTQPYSPLRLVELDPAEGSRTLETEQTIRLIMNRRIDFASLSDSAVYLADPDGERVPGIRDTAETAHIVTWRPQEPLWYETTYTMNVNSRLTDVDGVAFDQVEETYPDLDPFVAPLTTVSQPFGPRVGEVSPEAGAQAVWTTLSITVRFNMPVDSTTVLANQSFWLKRNGSVAVSGTIHNLEGEQISYVFTPHSELQRDTDYVVEVTSAVLDLDGVPLDQDREMEGYQSFTGQFHTENPPSVLSSVPPAGATDAAFDEPVRLTFSGNLDPATVTSETVQLLGSGLVPVACERTRPSPNEVVLTPIEPLAYLGTYLVSVDTLLKAQDGSLFDQESAPGRQLYEAFFWTAPESLHPKVDTVYPELGATDITVTDSIVVWFDMPVRPATVDEDAYLLTRTSGGGAPESVSADSIRVTPDSLRATFYPAGHLDEGSDYEITVTSGVLELGGYGLDQDPITEGLQSFVSTFSTLAETIPPRIIYVDPANEATGITLDETVVLQFNEAMDSASVAEAFSVRDGETPIEGLGSFDATRRFWTFEPDPVLTFGSLYTVNVDTTAFDLAGNFLDQNLVEEGLQAFQSVFTTITDNTQPTVLGIDPANHSDSVDVMVTIRVEFDEPMLPASAQAEGAFTVAAAGQPIHPGEVTFEDNDTVLVWVPDTALAFSTAYFVTANVEITDIYGNALDYQPGMPGDQPFQANFTTWDETVPPRVIALLPDIAEVPTTTSPTLVFSEPVDPVSLTDAIAMKLGEESIGFSLEVAATADSVTLVLINPLVQGSLYTVTVDTVVVDTLANGFDQDPDTAGRQRYVGQFLTEADTEAPVIETLTPADGASHVLPSTNAFLGFSEPLDPTTVSDANIYLTGPGGQVAVTLQADAWYQDITLVPDEPLVGGASYGIHVSNHVRDRGNLPFDSDPEAPGNQDLDTEFLVGRNPVIEWTGGVCAVGDSAKVLFDARESYDPDSLLADSVATVTWDWGDGEIDVLAGPAGLLATHDYGYQDIAGCDGLDNDGDGSIDESGESGCDESYHVRLEIQDAYGFSARDTAGVSFCAFLAFESEPVEGAEQVRPDQIVRITLTGPIDRESVTAASVQFTTEGGGQSIAFTAGYDDDDYVLVLDPDSNLSAGGYTVTLTGELTNLDGNRLDQDPATTPNDSFELNFSVNSEPVIGWDGGLCVSTGSSSVVSFDASASVDPDGGDQIAWAVWTWGDGESDSLAAPAGLATAHEFPFMDWDGCNGDDDDGDGDADETGAMGCDESYHVILRVYDTMGASVADTAGVSFCAFLVSDSEPIQGQTNFAADDTLRITCTRAIDLSSVDDVTAALTIAGGTVAYAATLETDDTVLVLVPANPLNPGSEYEFEITSGLLDSGGTGLDQDPETPAGDSFSITFTVAE